MSVLKNAISAFDPAPEKKEEIELALNLLYDLAQSKTDAFKKDIAQSLRTAGTEENPTIPITQVLGAHSETRAYVSDDNSKIITETTDAIKKFVSGGSDNIINGIGSLLSTGVNALLGTGTGIQSQREDYFVAVEGLAIIRVDVKSWIRKINVQGITNKIESVLAFTAVKSSVNVDKISFNTFLQAYKYQLERTDIPQQELIEEITNAKEIFNLLKTNDIIAMNPSLESSVTNLPSSSLA
ncbi:MAG: hypothetical protein NXI09_04565 [Bacteroidetes bacterium]|nr:hypothetical protein [Bacteroidota bacterium]